MSVIDEILDRIDPVEVIGEYVKLSHAGKEYRGLCPFHHEKTPSFYVNPDTGLYHCFGCGASGNIFRFIMDIEGIDFKEALSILAKRAGIELSEYKEQKEVHTLGRFAEYLHDILKNTHNPAMEYLLNKRRLKEKDIVSFKLGYYPEGALRSFIQRENLSSAFMVKLGLLKEGKRGFYEVFKGRLIFPIFSETGRIIGLGGRILDSSHSPKYINSPDSNWFKKGSHLYGYFHSKKVIRERRVVIITEGYMDVIAMHSAGFDYTVASLGTSFTEEHARLLSKHVDKAFLLFDSDEAGSRAVDRVIPILFKWGIVPFVVRLKEGKDPAELYEKDKVNIIRKALESAEDFVDFYLKGSDSEEQKIKMLKKLRYILELSYDDVLKGVYMEKIRNVSGVDLKVKYKVKVKKNTSLMDSEVKMLLVAFQFEELAQYIKTEFKKEWFTSLEAKSLYELIREGKNFDEVMATCDEEMAKRYVKFLETIDFGDEVRNTLKEDLKKKLIVFKKERELLENPSLKKIVELKKEEMSGNERLDNSE